MRRPLVIVLSAILLLSLAASVASSPASSYSLAVNRRIFINEWGVAAINDTVTVRNLGTEPVTEVMVGIPIEYAKDLNYISSIDQYQEGVTIEKDVKPSSSIYWMNFKFPTPVRAQESYNFSSVMVVDNIIRYVEGTFIYRFADTPSLADGADVCEVTILLPTGSATFLPPNFTFSQVDIGGLPSLVHTFKPLEPNRALSMSFNFTSVSIQFVRFKSVEREISFGRDGYVYVSDTYATRNLAASITSLTIQLPKGASKVMAYDLGGPLWNEVQDETEAAVSPRYGTIRGDENFTFTLSYRLPASGYVKQEEWWGLYAFTFDFLTSHPWTVEKLRVRVLMEEGMTLQQSTQHPNSTYVEDGKTILSFDLRGVTPLHNLTFKMEYKYLSFWAAFKPITLIAALELVICVFLVASRGKRVTPTVAAPVETIRRFIGMYDERTALKLELEKIEEDLMRGGVSKHDFRRRKKAIDLRLDEMNRSLASVKDGLRSVATRYDEMIRRMDKAEAEIDAARASEAQVRTQYRSGKITKDTYETVMVDLRKRIARAREALESTSITLREEAR